MRHEYEEVISLLTDISDSLKEKAKDEQFKSHSKEILQRSEHIRDLAYFITAVGNRSTKVVDSTALKLKQAHKVLELSIQAIEEVDKSLSV